MKMLICMTKSEYMRMRVNTNASFCTRGGNVNLYERASSCECVSQTLSNCAICVSVRKIRKPNEYELEKIKQNALAF